MIGEMQEKISIVCFNRTIVYYNHTYEKPKPTH